MRTSILGLDARYTVEKAITDYRMTVGYIVRCESRFIGYADSLKDAKYAAMIHASIFNSASPSARSFAVASGAVLH
jgi:hypothetical protein